MSGRRRGLTGWLFDPWRKPVFLATVTWGYIAWSILPVVIAIAFSFNAGRSRSAWQGFSTRWWFGTESAQESLLYSPSLRPAIFQSLRLAIITTLIAVPLGTLFAIGLDRWHGRGPGLANFGMLLSFVVPEIILGIALFLFFLFFLEKVVHLGTIAQILGLATFQLSYPVIVVRARLLSIGPEYEEAAMDLGGSPTQAVRRALFPLLYPAIFASAALVFADTIDDFVTVRYLSGPASSEPLSVKIYDAARGSPTPAVNAAATFMLVATLVVVVVVVFVRRLAGRGQQRQSATREFVEIQL
jgi:spermidine/putrescine transport system permease protein